MESRRGGKIAIFLEYFYDFSQVGVVFEEDWCEVGERFERDKKQFAPEEVKRVIGDGWKKVKLEETGHRERLQKLEKAYEELRRAEGKNNGLVL